MSQEDWDVKPSVRSGKSQSNKGIGATRSQPLGPWSPQHPENYLFATTNSKDEVQDILFRAQLAVLNPGQPYQRYKPNPSATLPTEMQVKFSPNVVRLDVGASTHDSDQG